jgi:peptidoglycan hydrolase-like protein with peptidoglycan-binding domain
MSTNNSTTHGKYDKFKTPVVEIFVGRSKDSLQKLPEQISRLVEKVEVTLTQEKETCVLPQITITFIEGSREPYSPIGDTAAIYGSEVKGLNNSAGFLTDLTVDNGGSIASLISSQAAALTTSFVGGNSINIEPKVPKNNYKYLFQEGSVIKVKIYYLESPQLSLTVLGYISVLESDFPSDDQPRTKITALGPSAELDKISPPVAVVFKKTDVLATTISPQTSKITQSFSSKNIYEILDETCKKQGLGLVVSSDLLAALQDPDKHFIWPAGKSFVQFLNDLASRSNAYFGVLIDPITLKDTVYFVSKSQYNSYVSIKQKSLFTYKAPGSLLKDVSVKVDFSTPTSVYHAGWDEKGKRVESGYEEHGKELVAITNAGAVNTLPKGDGASAVTKNLKEQKSISKVNAVPYNNKKIVQETAISSTACAHNKTVALEFNSLGYPSLIPGKIYIGGIGQRYSNYYTMINITHTVDDTGYTCKAVCTNDNLAAGGTASQDKKILNEPNDDQSDSISIPINAAANFLNAVNFASSSLLDASVASIDIDPNPKQTIDKFYT